MFLKYVQYEYCAKQGRLPISKAEYIPSAKYFSSAMASRSGQSSSEPDHLSSDDNEYVMPRRVAETTPGQRDCAARLLTATRVYLNSLPELPQTWGQAKLNLHDYHSDLMVICSTFWILDITDWGRQHEETHSKYANLSNVAPDKISIITTAVGVEASCSHGRDVFGWRQSKTTGETLRKNVVVRYFALANYRIPADHDPA